MTPDDEDEIEILESYYDDTNEDVILTSQQYNDAIEAIIERRRQ